MRSSCSVTSRGLRAAGSRRRTWCAIRSCNASSMLTTIATRATATAADRAMPTATDGWIDALIEIGRALARERDRDRLLALILEKSRYVTTADAGSIYVVEGEPGASGYRLRFKMSQNDSM